jgi:hypothetical protein
VIEHDDCKRNVEGRCTGKQENHKRASTL